MKHLFIFLISISFTFSESYLTKADVFLTSTLEGSNNNPSLDIAMEGLALATPFIEFGTAGLNQIRNENLMPSFAATFGVQLPIALGKYIFKRKRPERNYKPKLWNSRFTPSFPSGHAATTAAWATSTALASPRMIPAMIGYVIISGYSQVYVGNHYVSDIIAGWGLGYVVASFIYKLYYNNPGDSGVIPQLRIAIPLP